MCGIVGLIAKKPSGFWKMHADMFQDMLIMDQIRGMDGTGCFGIFKNRQATAVKIGTNASNAVTQKSFHKYMEQISKSMWATFGHNRKATVGSVSTKNSHPFVEDNIVLIHNGYIGNHKMMDDSSDVDSQALARVLNKKSPEDAVRDITGAYALVWYDKRDRKIRITRNHERPLWMAASDDLWMFASEPMLIAAAADRNHVKVNDMVSIGTMKIIEFAAGDRYNIEEIKPKTHSSWPHQYRGPQQPSREPYVPPTVSRPATVTALPVLNKPSWKQSIDEAIEEVGVGDKIAFIFKTGTVVEDNTKKVKFLDITGKFITTMGVEIDVDGRVDWADDLSEFYTSLPQDDQKRAWCVAEIAALGTSTCGGWIRVKDFDLAVYIESARKRSGT
jgi:asparagine synthetase B (glutamine-hydrolysing)